MRHFACAFSLLLAATAFSAPASAQDYAGAYASAPYATASYAAYAAPTMTQSYNLAINSDQVLRLSQPAGAVIVSDPQIADVFLFSDEVLFLRGRGYGNTSVKILNEAGQTILDANVNVGSSRSTSNVRMINMGTKGGQETYSCDPYCNPSPVLGDDARFRANFSQPPAKSSQPVSITSSRAGSESPHFNALRIDPEDDITGRKRQQQRRAQSSHF